MKLLRFSSCLIPFAVLAMPLSAQTNVFPATGNVGIGTTGPGERLTVTGGNLSVTSGNLHTNRGRLAFSNTAGDPNHTIYNNYLNIDGEGVWDGLKMNVYNGLNVRVGNADGTTPISALFINSTGNVGIGTTNPQAKLDVNGGIEPLFVRNGGSSRLFLGVNQSGGGYGRIGVYDDATLGWKNLILAEGGNVGVGTSTPSDKLTVYGGLLKVSTEGTHTAFVEGSVSAAYFGNTGAGRASFGNSESWETLVADNGNVGIGTSSPTHKLAVNGTIRAKEVIVDTGWADYVFKKGYRLAPLTEVEAHIEREGHLPGIPSAAEVAEHGVSMGEMQAKLLAKLEEHTLHLIAQEKAIQALQRENAELRERLKQVEVRP